MVRLFGSMSMIWGCIDASMKSCPFCGLDAGRMLMERAGWRVIADGYPVTPGHLLFIPVRHVSSFRELSDEEWGAVFALIKLWSAKVKEEDASVEGVNVGINDGRAAGQTVMHAHIHLIPRRAGDVQNPTGGVRGVIPGKAVY